MSGRTPHGALAPSWPGTARSLAVEGLYPAKHTRTSRGLASSNAESDSHAIALTRPSLVALDTAVVFSMMVAPCLSGCLRFDGTRLVRIEASSEQSEPGMSPRRDLYSLGMPALRARRSSLRRVQRDRRASDYNRLDRRHPRSLVDQRTKIDARTRRGPEATGARSPLGWIHLGDCLTPMFGEHAPRAFVSRARSGGGPHDVPAPAPGGSVRASVVACRGRWRALDSSKSGRVRDDRMARRECRPRSSPTTSSIDCRSTPRRRVSRARGFVL